MSALIVIGAVIALIAGLLIGKAALSNNRRVV